MFHQITSLDAASKRKLMDLYYEGNLENADYFYPEITDKAMAVEKVETDFLNYLNTSFFSSPENVYWVLEENFIWVSALRLYKIIDGPNCRLPEFTGVQLEKCLADDPQSNQRESSGNVQLYYIEALETHPEYRHQGYASKLLSGVIEELKMRGPFRLCDCVGKKNTASIKTHEKCGFAIVSEEGFDYLNNTSDKRDYGMQYSYFPNSFAS